MHNAYCPSGFTGNTPPQLALDYVPADALDWSVGPEHSGTGVLHVQADGFTLVHAYGPVTFGPDDLREIEALRVEAFGV